MFPILYKSKKNIHFTYRNSRNQWGLYSALELEKKTSFKLAISQSQLKTKKWLDGRWSENETKTDLDVWKR